jgi:segregation and condensation protein B
MGRVPVMLAHMSHAPKPSAQPPVPQESSAAKSPTAENSPLSLDRLRAAFAQMLGSDTKQSPARVDATETSRNEQPVAAPDPCEISPRTVVEAMLFVGRPDDRPFSAREMAAAMRGVSPAEIEAAVAELRAAYERDSAPYEIVGTAEGFRLALRSDLSRMRDKLNGRIREAKLTPAAVEVLSIVAYNQPTTVDAINELRGATSGAVLQSLVRRKLVRVDRGADRTEPPRYSTTDRFLRLFRLENLSALPRNEELEKL